MFTPVVCCVEILSVFIIKEQHSPQPMQRRRKEILPGAELIKCIDPNEGEALRRGGLGASLLEPGGSEGHSSPHLQTWGDGAPLPPVPPPMQSTGMGELLCGGGVGVHTWCNRTG